MCDLSSVRGACRIRFIQAESVLRRHVETLGLVPGTRVQVVSSGRSGCVIELRGCRIAIGRTLADSILVDGQESQDARTEEDVMGQQAARPVA